MKRTVIGLVLLLLLLPGCGRQTDPAPETPVQTTPAPSTLLLPEESGPDIPDSSAPPEGSGSATPGGKAAGGAVPAAAVPSRSGGLHVEGTRLMDTAGQPVQLRGISTHGLAWFPDYVNKACFQQLRDEWNVNVIRLAMYTAESGGYCTGGDQTALKELIRSGVRYATELDMYVIIDWHILSDGNPQRYQKEAKAFFNEMSEEFADADNVLYEICNEPNGGVSWSQIKSYAEAVIAAIRGNDSDAVILVGTPNWSQYVDQAAKAPITGYDNLMYTLHFYAGTHQGDLRDKMETAIEDGLPIFVSEYGICDASGSGAVNEAQADRWVELMDRLGVSYVAWNLSNKNETSAILRSSCKKTSGFTESDLSPSGKWLYRTLTGSRSLPAPGPSPSPSPSTPASPAPERPSPAPSSGSLQVQAELVNRWEDNGTPVFQYVLTLQNSTGSAVSQWAVDITFQETPEFSQGWNGEYSLSGKTLHITSKDYNGSIPSGGSVSDIGFIVRGGGGITGSH